MSLGVILFAYLFGSLSETTQTGSWFETRLSLLKARESSFQTESVVFFFLLKDALIDSLLDKRESLVIWTNKIIPRKERQEKKKEVDNTLHFWDNKKESKQYPGISI